MNAQIWQQWTRDLADLVERRDIAARDAAKIEGHVCVLRLHQFFGYHVWDALRAGATWRQVVAESGWERHEVDDIYVDWGYAQFGSGSQEELAEVLAHLEQYRREYDLPDRG